MVPKRKVLAESCVMLFIGHFIAAFQRCGLLFQCCGLLFQCCGLLLALHNVFLDIVQHNSFRLDRLTKSTYFVFDVDEDAPEFFFLFAVFDFVIETTSIAAFSSKGKASFYASASLFVNCLSFLFSGVVLKYPHHMFICII
jgi:hypothetical protein